MRPWEHGTGESGWVWVVSSFPHKLQTTLKGPRDFHRTKSSCLHFTPSLNSNRHLMPPLPKVLSTWAPEIPCCPNSSTALWSQHAHSCLAGPPPIPDHHQGSAGSVSPFFSLYTTFLGGLTQVSVFKCHPYANDSQIHFSSPKLSPELWIPESSFIWICSRHLKFNMSQTECLSFPTYKNFPYIQKLP